MKVLVTGGAGFIGSHLVDRLISLGYDTYVIDNLSIGNKQFLHPKAHFFHVDILEKLKIRAIFEVVKPEIVFHLAAQIDVQTSILNPVFDAQVNIIGSLNIIELCKEFNSKIIYSSTAAVYGNPLKLPIDEKHPTKPISNYGLSKMTPEHYIQSYSQLYNLKYTILRYANVYGIRQLEKGEGGAISIFMKKIKEDMELNVYGDGNQTRDFIYVDDVVSANIAAMNIEKNQIFNISTNQQISINELIKTISKIMKKEIHPIYKEKKPGDILRSCLSNQLAKKYMGWEPKFSIADGITLINDFYFNKSRRDYKN